MIGLGLLSSWLLAGDFAGGAPIAGAVGALSIFMYFFYKREGAISTSGGKRIFRRWLFVPIAMVVIWSMSQFHPVLGALHIGDRSYIHLIENDTWAPVTSLRGMNWTTMLYPCFIMMSAVGLIAFTQSQFALQKVLNTLTMSAMILAAIGAVGAVLHWRKILTYITPAQSDFYAVFPSGHQWAAFALFWTVVGFGVLMHVRRRGTWKSLFAKNGVWWILGWFLLAGSVYWTGAPVHRFLLGVGLGLLMLATGVGLAGRGRTGAISVLVGLILGAAGLALTGFSVFTFASTFTEAQANTGMSPFGIPWEVQSALWRDAWALFEQRPVFGWGAGTFSDVFPFQQQIDLHHSHYASPHSDLLKALVEYGAVGVALWLLFPLALLIQFARLSVHRRLSHYLWGAATLLALLALVSQPLSTPANFVCIWLGAAMAYQWSNAAAEAQKRTDMIRQSPRFTSGEANSKRHGHGSRRRSKRAK